MTHLLRKPLQCLLNQRQVLTFHPFRGAKMRAQKLEVGPNRYIAYRQVPGQRQPTIVFVPGLHSYLHMRGMTARALLRFCDLNDFPAIIYDHEGTGESDPGDPILFKEILFTNWVEDVKAVIEQLTEGPIVLVGCSMGGWLALVVGEQLKEKLHGMLLYAPAINYVYPYFERQLAKLPPNLQQKILDGDQHIMSMQSMGNALMKRDFAEDSRTFEINLKEPLDIVSPVRILHGLKDAEVPFEQSIQLCQAIKSEDVDVIFRKNGPHQLEQPIDIEIFLNTLDRMLKDHPA